MKINRIFTIVFLQGLLGLGLFLGACSSLNDTISEINLPPEENLEVAATRDLDMTIAIEERGEIATYNLDTFASRYPEQYQMMIPALRGIVTDTDTARSGACGVASDSGEWVILCIVDGSYCAVGGTGIIPTGLECGTVEDDGETPMLLTDKQLDTDVAEIQFPNDWCRWWFVPPGPYDNPFPIPFPDNHCKWW